MTPTPHAPVGVVPLATGDIVGEETTTWEIVRHLAEGGFSSVYVVRPATERTRNEFGPEERALKCIRGTEAKLTQVRDEAERIAEVEGHENVLGLITSFRFTLPNEDGEPDRAGAADDAAEVPQEAEAPRSPAAVVEVGEVRASFVGLVLELAAQDLYGFARRMRPDEHGWAGIFEQVAAGLEHIHSRRVVHGDIKPSNVLRVGPAFKIADFGVSTRSEPAIAAPALTARTLAYLPPESCQNGDFQTTEPAVRLPGARPTAAEQRRTPGREEPDGQHMAPSPGWKPDQSSDVWALAVTMHRMLTGRHITAGVTPEHQYDLVCQARYSIDDRLSPGWRRLFTDCLAHRPEDRSVITAAELRRRLAELAVPEDYVGVPWIPGAPRLVAVLNPGPQSAGAAGADRDQEPGRAEPEGGRALVLYLTRPGGRVQGIFATPGGVLLDTSRHLHETAVPALAQQVRDAQRAGARAADERDKLQAEVARLAASGPSTEIMDSSAPTEQIKRLSAEVTNAVRQRDELSRDRDRLARERFALARRVEQLEREAAVPRPAVPRYGYDYPPYPQQSRGRSVLGCFLVFVLAVTIAATIALLVGSGLAGDPPQDVIDQVVDRIKDAVRG